MFEFDPNGAPIITKGGIRMQEIEPGLFRIEPCFVCGNVLPNWCEFRCERMRQKVAPRPIQQWNECNFCGETLVPIAQGENDICVDCAHWLSNWDQQD